jgi:hypothetical protein
MVFGACLNCVLKLCSRYVVLSIEYIAERRIFTVVWHHL